MAVPPELTASHRSTPSDGFSSAVEMTRIVHTVSGASRAISTVTWTSSPWIPNSLRK